MRLVWRVAARTIYKVAFSVLQFSPAGDGQPTADRELWSAIGARRPALL